MYKIRRSKQAIWVEVVEEGLEIEFTIVFPLLRNVAIVRAT